MSKITLRNVLIAAGFAVLLIVLGLFLFGSYRRTFQPSFVTAVATSLLALITAIYAIMTYLLVRETKRARELESIPALKLDLEPWAIGVYGVVIENIGNGPARDVEAELSLLPGDQTATIQYPNVAPGSEIPVPQPFEEDINSEIHEEYDEIKVKGTCKDLFDNDHSFEDTFDLEMLAQEHGPAGIMGRDETVSELRDIRRELDDIEGELRDLNRNL